MAKPWPEVNWPETATRQYKPICELSDDSVWNPGILISNLLLLLQPSSRRLQFNRQPLYRFVTNATQLAQSMHRGSDHSNPYAPNVIRSPLYIEAIETAIQNIAPTSAEVWVPAKAGGLPQQPCRARTSYLWHHGLRNGGTLLTRMVSCTRLG